MKAERCPSSSLAKYFLVIVLLSAGMVFTAGTDRLPAQAVRPWRLTSWSSPVGAQSLTYESLCGLRALLVFLNANQALGGREVELFSLDLDDSRPEFISRLTNLVDQKKPDLAVGGAANAFPQLTANFFRRRGIFWFGPWSNSPGLIDQTQEQNPLLLLPGEEEELEALLTYARRLLGPGREVLLIHLDDLKSRYLLQLAQKQAGRRDLTVRPLAVPAEFRDWGSLSADLDGVRAVILWVPPGQAAALVRTFKPRLSREVIWMTSSLNSPGQELTNMTGGQWENMIFASVLNPSSAISPTYEQVIRKYGLPGLNLDYQTYLGFAQGQLLARVLNSQPQNFRAVFPETSAQGTLLYRPDMKEGVFERNFYLAQSDRLGGWRPLPQ
ncbi:MAG: ABC transporter substrate-binding protein [Deltaproteobacteria bacterium]|nr:ABC transporter substrate-binding protein [Deltaproteobacteria bacterium]